MRGCACRGTSGFVHVSCLAEQAKILVAEAEENNLDDKVFDERWARWYRCSLCEQWHHGFVACALGWACWKTYLGRPETDTTRCLAMSVLGAGLQDAEHNEDALSVQEAELSMLRRLGASEHQILVVQTNLATTYDQLGRSEEALSMRREVYSGRLKLHGEEYEHTLTAANNYAYSLVQLKRFEEAKSLMRKTMPVARRVFGASHEYVLRTRGSYGQSLYENNAATLDDLREAVETYDDTRRIARRTLGGAHPLTAQIEHCLQKARAALRAREALSPGGGA